MDVAPAVRWKLAATLKERGVTPYGLVKASGLAQATVYAIAQGKAQAVELETLTKLVAGIERLTGKPAAVNDLLEVARETPAPAQS